jgi:hypothetical protein
MSRTSDAKYSRSSRCNASCSGVNASRMGAAVCQPITLPTRDEVLLVPPRRQIDNIAGADREA